MQPTNSLTTDYSKQTVTHLRALCKERRLTCYSKLSKPALVQKLVDADAGKSSGAKSSAVAPSQTQRHGNKVENLTLDSHSSHIANASMPETPQQVLSQPEDEIRSIKQPPKSDSHTTTAVAQPLQPPPANPAHSGNISSPLKRIPDAYTDPAEPASKKHKHTAGSNLPGSVKGNGTATKGHLNHANNKIVPKSLVFESSKSQDATIFASEPPPGRAAALAASSLSTMSYPRTMPHSIAQSSEPIEPTTKSTTSSQINSGRPLPLHDSTIIGNVDRPRAQNLLPVSLLSATTRFKAPTATKLLSPSPFVKPSPKQSPLLIGPAALTYLDFPSTGLSSVLLPITLPPSKTQRKSVYQFSIILSALSNADRRNCILCSRMLRYAVYLSASALLNQSFPGRRLDFLLQDHVPSMTNMWPYLRQRQDEVSTRKHIYQNSFLAQVLDSTVVISPRLWASPDNEKQATIALRRVMLMVWYLGNLRHTILKCRFVLTRFWFLVSANGDKHASWWGIVTDVQEVVQGEIWSVTVRYTASTEVFYVLEATCEVVGHPTPRARPTCATYDAGVPLRADWSAYIAHRVSQPSAHGVQRPALLEHLKWTNYEEYDRGISKLWLKRVMAEGAHGTAKKTVAERYVLACVVGNSVSGKWMSSTEMAQEFAGLAAGATPVTTPKAQKIHLFLPGHHHVESVHFTAPDGTPLHPALAAVQTPTREYYVLRDNGMQVGCEEDGIADVWRRLLGCNAQGGVTVT